MGDRPQLSETAAAVLQEFREIKQMVDRQARGIGSLYLVVNRRRWARESLGACKIIVIALERC